MTTLVHRLGSIAVANDGRRARTILPNLSRRGAHFDGEQDFDACWDARMSEACTVLDPSSEGVWRRGAVTVATCSYNYWSNERTVTYLADAR